MLALAAPGSLTAAGSVPSPEQFIGFKVGTDRKLARWDQIVEYMRRVAQESDRIRVRELGRTDGGNPFLALEVSSADTLKNLGRFKQLERKLYFQDGPPSAQERDEIFRHAKAVVLVTCSVHASEIGATQMALELVHRLATDDSPAVTKILDNVILLLVPSANPDGQILVTDWFNDTVGTPYEGSLPPSVTHPYAGHDSNRDMYMLTQRESRYLAYLAWHDWFPAVWLDQHQMGSAGPRMFVMPAADPINPNVHPLIYRWTAILGQSQAAALEAAGKDGIIYNSMYTSFWEGALAWSGWWHNQIGLLTEVASVRVASAVDQMRVSPDGGVQTASNDRRSQAAPIPPPGDIARRAEYPRPWLGGHWTLRDIVDYELIATMALLETAADRREAILRQIYEVNRQTVEGRGLDDLRAIVVPTESQHDPREAGHLVERLILGGVEVQRAEAPFELDGRKYAAGTFVVPMTQVFARYAKDLLERQNYPEVRRNGAVEPPYDVTAWSLGMLLGVNVDFVKTSLPTGLPLVRVRNVSPLPGSLLGNGQRFAFAYRGPDTVTAINRLLADGARVWFEAPSRVAVTGVARARIEALAREFGLRIEAGPATRADGFAPLIIRAPRIGLYSPWTGDNIDDSWTRWILAEHEFESTTLDSAEIRKGDLRRRFDALIIADQDPREIVQGRSGSLARPEHTGGIGGEGIENLKRFLAEGGTLVALGGASEFAVDRLAIPARDIKRSLRRDEHFAPGTIVRLEVDTSQPIGFGMAPSTYGFYTNGPLLAPAEGVSASRATVVARYPDADVLASGWLRGEEVMAGRAAVMSIDMEPGRVILFGLRPQHRAQTRATFPLLFNSLYLAAATAAPVVTTQ
jgi:hypothetical protein